MDLYTSRKLDALVNADPDTVCDVLEISSQELIETFADKVERYLYEGEGPRTLSAEDSEALREAGWIT